MTLTCYGCPVRIAFPGSRRDHWARLFGWIERGGRYFCAACGALPWAG